MRTDKNEMEYARILQRGLKYYNFILHVKELDKPQNFPSTVFSTFFLLLIFSFCFANETFCCYVLIFEIMKMSNEEEMKATQMKE
jgi:hypothetical protein